MVEVKEAGGGPIANDVALEGVGQPYITSLEPDQSSSKNVINASIHQ
jgi:hypothetical protein